MKKRSEKCMEKFSSSLLSTWFRYSYWFLLFCTLNIHTIHFHMFAATTFIWTWFPAPNIIIIWALLQISHQYICVHFEIHEKAFSFFFFRFLRSTFPQSKQNYIFHFKMKFTQLRSHYIPFSLRKKYGRRKNGKIKWTWKEERKKKTFFKIFSCRLA